MKKSKPFYYCALSIIDGSYIGDTKTANRLWKKFGIEEFHLAQPSHKVCSIGFSPSRQKWYGWSHRAIYGFGIGFKIKKGDCGAESLSIGFKAKTLNDCKKMAIAFAESVS